ncbi:E3 ubiquitin-protein ligase RBBP6 isoform X3 [Ostrinia furnacalis]|uniref:E3 ubiquitin-protein ligase RBBP6 isoform X3 n=1 Tax=Ostrinia furnacalis TaxID=93504 RepID=UPI00103C3CD9|nr:E3 ubiquitin-protein ligase RBBP6 isoform X3 [Ostrinia furnacalis]
MEVEAAVPAVEPVLELPSNDNNKLNEVSEKPFSVQEDTSLKSNGVAESANVIPSLAEADKIETHGEVEADSNVCTTSSETISENASNILCSAEVPPIVSNSNEEMIISEGDNIESTCESLEQELDEKEMTEGIVSTVEETKVSDATDVQMEESLAESDNVDSVSNENVRFETEILVESNDVNEVEIDSSKPDDTNNILSELGQNIELSEVLRSSDVSENSDNNNCAVRQEVFNKEELLDILEGNDAQSTADYHAAEVLHLKSTTLEAQMAMEQLSRLRNDSRKIKQNVSMNRKRSVLKPTNIKGEKPNKQGEKSTRKGDKPNNKAEKPNNKGEKPNKGEKSIKGEKTNEKGEKPNEKGEKQNEKGEKPNEKGEKPNEKVENQSEKPNEKGEKSNSKLEKPKNKEDKPNSKEESIVSALVSDWDDEDLPDDDNSKVNESSESLPIDQTESLAVKEEPTNTNRTSIDSAASDGQTPIVNKTIDDTQPQRRLGRVIKKKVIFDPDNPDTYTQSKTHKNKETQNDAQPSKKIKLEQTVQRPKSKSPVSKMQWKKPTPKNSKQIKRLSEVDKLLMDEGAVNMIYQLTPEAPKGKKNMRTKAEFIKKLQSSTPEGKEMKFRERKKECLKSEDAEAKKISGGKQRSSLSSSVKSPQACEDFETHSADDSIIYRRHSSSSYSSSCMSPRRLSDVETNAGVTNTSQTSKDQTNVNCEDGDMVMDVVPQESPITKEMINKDDCLSIKKKLNSKLSLALNKRKRESSKTDKPTKKKIIKTEGDHKEDDVEVDVFKYLSITFHKGVAIISVRNTGFIYNADVLYELEEALSGVDRRSDISLTLMTSECGTLCSNLDLTPLLEDDDEKRAVNAQHIAEGVRSVLSAVARHSKLVVAGAWGACRGVGLALLALADVPLAAEGASFALAGPAPHAAGPAPRAASLTPGVVAVVSAQPLPQSLVNDLVIFERQLSASEALQRGLVSRVLWPTGVMDQLQSIVSEIANQPVQTLLLKKKLLKLRTNSDNTFLAQLEAERALFVEYWSSKEGLETLAHRETDPLKGV